MVVKMMKWRPWPPLQSKKFEVKITIHQLRIVVVSPDVQDSSRFSVLIKWKGSKGISLSSLRKSVRRNFTKEGLLGEDGTVRWDEEFRCLCNFSPCKENEGFFHPWELSFTIFHGLKQNISSFATASLNIADFVSTIEKQGRQISIPLSDTNTSLDVSIILLEQKNTEEQSEPLPRPVLLFPRSPCYGEMFSIEKEQVSTLKASPIRVNIFKGLSALRAKKPGHEDEGSDGRSSDRSEDVEYSDPFDSDSQDDVDEGDSEEVNEDCSRKSFGYGTLAYANHAGVLSHSNTSSSEDEDWIFFSRHNTKAPLVQDHKVQQNSKLRLLPWKKRKLSFRSPKVKGEPLLKKYYGEEGGDDIDFDRRQLSSSDESCLRKNGDNLAATEPSAFGDDSFAVGIWEHKEITSRDGQMKLKTQVFFASIDQRSERAAGESACTALVAVIADWLHSNADAMPIKSQLDSLIGEGSLEWRNLCENDTYKECFPDKHFDLETVLEANVRLLSVVPEKSFVGFFRPEGFEDKGFDFLQGAMTFDNIWDEIHRSSLEVASQLSDPLVYIISWNDHFFVLKVEKDAYYIIDTLGERLYEGGNQAFILKFDKDSIIHRIANEDHKSDDSKRGSDDNAEGSNGKEGVTSDGGSRKDVQELGVGVVCTGKESCKEYIKGFLAAIPIRELQVDLKKGLMASTTPLHHRLQIEFHYTKAVVNDENGTLPLEELEGEKR